MFTVYILKSLKNNRYYTGSTDNLERRFAEHNSGKSTYTRLTRPFVLIHSEQFETRKEAVKRELFLKTGKGREWIKAQFSRTVA
jgi:putative endonuclease